MNSKSPFAVTRRNFIASVSSLVGSCYLADTAIAQQHEDIRVAQIGLRNQGWNHVKSLHRNIVAICDVDRKLLDQRRQEIEERFSRKVDTSEDFRKLLDRQDIDAVSIATPNHTHALITILAASAGKDVYVEKPASHSIWEGRQMVEAARKYQRVIQCGTQSRSSPSLQAAVEFVRDGGLGKIEFAMGTCYKPRMSIGKLEEPLQIPSHVNYDLWCGPAEVRDLYRPNLHYDWHWDFNTGNGDLGNQGIHQMDIARWFLGETSLAPRCISLGGRFGYEDAGNTPNTQIVFFDYENAPLLFETRGLPRSQNFQKPDLWPHSMESYRGSGIGVIVQCENGHVLIPSYTEAIAYDGQGNELKRWKGGSDHHANWLKAIAARDESILNGHISEGHLSSALCASGGVSHQLGSKLGVEEIAEQIDHSDLLSHSFDRMVGHLRANGIDVDNDKNSITMGPWLEIDPATEQFTNSQPAEQLSKREYRKGFEVPDIIGAVTQVDQAS